MSAAKTPITPAISVVLQNIKVLETKRDFYRGVADAVLKTKPEKTTSTLKLWIGSVDMNVALQGSLDGKHECAVVCVEAHIPERLEKCLEDMRADDFLTRTDPIFLANTTVASMEVGSTPDECMWVRDIQVKSPIPVLVKDQQAISMYYQKPLSGADGRGVEIVSHTLNPLQLQRLFAKQPTAVVYNPNFAQGHEILSVVRIWADAKDPNITHCRHFGVYCAPGKPLIIYKPILGKTICNKYAGLHAAYAKQALTKSA
jgi:hypothetical protein